MGSGESETERFVLDTKCCVTTNNVLSYKAPSIIISQGWNIVLIPSHKNYKSLQIIESRKFTMDFILLK